MLATEDRPLTLADVDEDLGRRWSWWAWMPGNEKRVLLEAVAAGNERRVAFLAEIGERRERAKASERCLYAPMRLRTESGEACVDDDGQQIVVQFAVPPGSRPNCNCIYAALADDGLSRYLDDRNPLSVRSTLSYVAQHLHADEGWSIEDAIAKWKARDEARHRAVLAGRLPPQGPNR
jgi:hypothetical protein